MWLGDLDGVHHFGLRFADADATDRVTVEVHRDQFLRTTLAELGGIGALHDAEVQLALGAGLLGADGGPVERTLDGGLQVTVGCPVWGAFVEQHCDVGAKFALDGHRFPRTKEEHLAAEVRAKLDAVVSHLANLGQTVNLKPAAVGEDRLVPVHEPVQSAGLADDVQSRAEEQVIRVAEQNLRPYLFEFAQVERLDAGLRADRHEHRRVDHAARGRQPAKTRLATWAGFKQLIHSREDRRISLARRRLTTHPRREAQQFSWPDRWQAAGAPGARRWQGRHPGGR